MLQRIKTFITVTLGISMLALPGLIMPAAVFADNPISNAICEGVESPTNGSLSISSAQSGTCSSTSGNSSSLQSILKLVVNVLSVVVGFVAVVMIIVAGFRYITSGGESGKVTGAKNAIVYAIVGLIIVALAQVIVRFVINRTGAVN